MSNLVSSYRVIYLLLIKERRHQQTEWNVLEYNHDSQDDNHDITISVQENIGKKTTKRRSLSTLLSSIPTRIRPRRTECTTKTEEGNEGEETELPHVYLIALSILYYN
jgi:hypothetical protein